MYRPTSPLPPPGPPPGPPPQSEHVDVFRPRHGIRLTWLLVASIVAVFGAQELIPGFEDRYAVLSDAVREGEWWRLATGAFVHGGAAHVAANAYFGWFIGARLERFIGPWRLLAISVVAMLGSSLGVVLVGQNAVGFSGVLYGWLASWLAFHLTPRFPGLRLSGPQRKAYLQALGANLLISLIPGVSLVGHLGGFVAGFVAAAALGMGRPEPAPATFE